MVPVRFRISGMCVWEFAMMVPSKRLNHAKNRDKQAKPTAQAKTRRLPEDRELEPLNDLQLGVLEKVKLPLAKAWIPGSLFRRAWESVHCRIRVGLLVHVAPMTYRWLMHKPDPISHF